MAYTAALSLMRNLVEIKGKSDLPEILLLLEHEPVLTMGRRSQDDEIVVSQFLDSNILPAELRGVVSKFLCHEFDLECKEHSLAMLLERMEKEKG